MERGQDEETGKKYTTSIVLTGLSLSICLLYAVTISTSFPAAVSQPDLVLSLTISRRHLYGPFREMRSEFVLDFFTVVFSLSLLFAVFNLEVFLEDWKSYLMSRHTKLTKI